MGHCEPASKEHDPMILLPKYCYYYMVQYCTYSYKRTGIGVRMIFFASVSSAPRGTR